ncbi:unnamed protein product, partial [Closterium sp. NIES-54]
VFLLDEIEKGRLELSYCPTSEMAAGYLTKKLGKSNASWLPVIGQEPLFLSEQWSEQVLQGSPWRATCPSPFLKSGASLRLLPPPSLSVQGGGEVGAESAEGKVLWGGEAAEEICVIVSRGERGRGRRGGEGRRGRWESDEAWREKAAEGMGEGVGGGREVEKTEQSTLDLSRREKGEERRKERVEERVRVKGKGGKEKKAGKKGKEKKEEKRGKGTEGKEKKEEKKKKKRSEEKEKKERKRGKELTEGSGGKEKREKEETVGKEGKGRKEGEERKGGKERKDKREGKEGKEKKRGREGIPTQGRSRGSSEAAPSDDDPHALIELGESQMASNQIRAALDSFSRAVALIPNDVEAWRLQGWGHKEAGNRREAEASFSRSVQLNERSLYTTTCFHSRHSNTSRLLSSSPSSNLLRGGDAVIEEACVKTGAWLHTPSLYVPCPLVHPCLSFPLLSRLPSAASPPPCCLVFPLLPLLPPAVSSSLCCLSFPLLSRLPSAASPSPCCLVFPLLPLLPPAVSSSLCCLSFPLLYRLPSAASPSPCCLVFPLLPLLPPAVSSSLCCLSSPLLPLLASSFHISTEGGGDAHGNGHQRPLSCLQHQRPFQQRLQGEAAASNSAMPAAYHARKRPSPSSSSLPSSLPSSLLSLCWQEGWARVFHPAEVVQRGYAMLTDSHALLSSLQRRQLLLMQRAQEEGREEEERKRKGRRAERKGVGAGISLVDRKRELLTWADSIGRRVHYNVTGFVGNPRQQRAAGLAALEIMQRVRRAWGEWMGGGRVERGSSAEEVEEGVGVGWRDVYGMGGSSAEEVEEGVGVGWRDVYGMGVRWRQVAEPNDPIVWIDGLTRESFESGFGSTTPMVSGPAHNIRYAMHAPRALEMVKAIIGEQGKVYRGGYEEIVLSQHALQQVAAASDHTHLWHAVQQPFFVFTPCHSTASPNKTLNGTRLALLTRPYGVEFLIETVLTPHRWSEFDAEMAASWKAVCLAVANTPLRESDLPAYRKAVQDSILRMAYYWYNFMPLARGTAMTGHVITLGLLLAIDLHASQPIPPAVQ